MDYWVCALNKEKPEQLAAEGSKTRAESSAKENKKKQIGAGGRFDIDEKWVRE
jgi:hypothetical protein